MNIAKNFRMNLRAALIARGMTQRDLARASGVHEVTISKIINGREQPSLEICEKLAKAAGIKLPKIFSE